MTVFLQETRERETVNIQLTMHEVLPTGHARCGQRQFQPTRDVTVTRVPCRECLALSEARNEALRPQFNRLAGHYTRGLITFDEMLADLVELQEVTP